MSSVLTALALIAAGYLIGSLPWGYWLPLLVQRVDIRTVGSGNTGATNVWRTFGFKLGLAVALLDIAKGAAAALLALWLADDLVALLAGAARPSATTARSSSASPAGERRWRSSVAWDLRWRLRDAVRCGGLDPRVPRDALRLGGLDRRRALAAAFRAPVRRVADVLLFTAAAALAVVLLHRTNIQRLRARTEKRITLRRGRSPSPPSRPRATRAAPSGAGRAWPRELRRGSHRPSLPLARGPRGCGSSRS